MLSSGSKLSWLMIFKTTSSIWLYIAKVNAVCCFMLRQLIFVWGLFINKIANSLFLFLIADIKGVSPFFGSYEFILIPGMERSLWIICMSLFLTAIFKTVPESENWFIK